jgi:hypothetical protein
MRGDAFRWAALGVSSPVTPTAYGDVTPMMQEGQMTTTTATKPVAPIMLARCSSRRKWAAFDSVSPCPAAHIPFGPMITERLPVAASKTGRNWATCPEMALAGTRTCKASPVHQAAARGDSDGLAAQNQASGDFAQRDALQTSAVAKPHVRRLEGKISGGLPSRRPSKRASAARCERQRRRERAISRMREGIGVADRQNCTVRANERGSFGLFALASQGLAFHRRTPWCAPVVLLS